MTSKTTVITMKITIKICKVSITKLNVRQPHATPKIFQEDCKTSRNCAKLASQRNVKTTDKCMKVWTQCVQTWTVNGKLTPRLKCVPPLVRQKTSQGDRRHSSDSAKTQPRKSVRSIGQCRTIWSYSVKVCNARREVSIGGHLAQLAHLLRQLVKTRQS